jgi:hypothetical protein
MADQMYWTVLVGPDADVAWLLAKASQVRGRLVEAQAELESRDAPVADSRVSRASVGTDGVSSLSAADSRLRDLPEGRRGGCRLSASSFRGLAVVDVVNLPDWCVVPTAWTDEVSNNTYVLVDPQSTPVGGMLTVCAGRGVPSGFEEVEWFRDAKRCPADRHFQWTSEPNVAVLRRVR